MTPPITHEHEADRRMRLAREWDELIEQVRGQDGFEDFLRPPQLGTLLPAAEKGPVVIVNVSRWRCDALIVRLDGVTVRNLPDLTLEQAGLRASEYLTTLAAAESADLAHALALRTAEDGDGIRAAQRTRRTADAVITAQEQANRMLLHLQEWMWDAIADPVLAELGLDRLPEGPTNSWPRLWWCPTGPLSVLPLHSAGYHDPSDSPHAPRTVLDRVVSSYTPTLRALLQARSRAPEAPDDASAASRAESPELLVVAVADAPGQAPLDIGVEKQTLLSLVPEHRRTVLEGPAADRDTVLAALPHHRWVHFSCHGDQDLANPSQGGVRLHDEMLTIADISSAQFRGDFAGLSACKTAVGGINVPDEAITVAAALHYTGYRHVVAALWSVQDDASSDLFSTVYRNIIVDGQLYPDQAAAALHNAVRGLRKKRWDWPHIWTPFTHTGP
jgi:hypothetical protein